MKLLTYFYRWGDNYIFVMSRINCLDNNYFTFYILDLPGDRKVVKICSGTDHIAMLTSDGELYTVGCAEQGQLGRVAERFVARGGRRGLELLLQPDRVHAKNRRTVFADVWAGSYDTLALSNDNEVLVCGLNNYNQVNSIKYQRTVAFFFFFVCLTHFCSRM